MNLPFLCLSGLCAAVTCVHGFVLRDQHKAARPSRDLLLMAVSTGLAALATSTFFVLAVLA